MNARTLIATAALLVGAARLNAAPTQTFFWPALPAAGQPAQANLKTIVRQALHNAQREILVQARELTDPDLADELVLATTRGVKVVVILEATQETNADTQGVYLQRHGVTVLTDRLVGTQGATVCTIDAALVITGTPTWTTADLASNGNALAAITDSSVSQFDAYFWSRALDTANTPFSYHGKTAAKRQG